MWNDLKFQGWLEAAILREYGRHSGVRRGCGVNKRSSMMVGGKFAPPSIKRQGGDLLEFALELKQKTGLLAGTRAGRNARHVWCCRTWFLRRAQLGLR
ncbi:hypothetical protein A2U01_0049076 [Trifolium medium]|uniref:Uncharacterized protein n=1 Tax=Trifolium medium TaxID=97028 RepID=A0A392QWI0_9FABA|nr:hypothetical protein [Trifolium medium]